MISRNCTSCGNLIENEANVVNGQHYHPTCFTCDKCRNPLGAEKYFILKGGNYCKNCKDVSLNVLVFNTILKIYQETKYCCYSKMLYCYSVFWKAVLNVERRSKKIQSVPKDQMMLTIQTALFVQNVDVFYMENFSRTMMEVILVKHVLW